MYDPFERNARRNRSKALFLTLFIHGALLGGILMSSSVDWQEYVPAFVQEWMGMEDEESVAVQLPDQPEGKAVRP